MPTPIPEQYRILYTSGSQLYLTNLAGDTVEKISAAGKSIWFPTVSPDNQKIAYWSSASGFFELWVYGIQQKIPQQLTFFNEKTTQTILRNFNVHNAPAWTPDSKRIIFSHLGKIWSVDATGFNLETLVPLGFHFSPALSADGKFLVYISEIDQYRNLFVRQLSTGDEWPVTQFPASHLVGSPSWSPNGKHIAFTVSFFEKADIWMVDIDGTGLKRLTKDGYSNSPAWAPAGERIAFSSGRQDPYRWEIWVMNQDGSSQFCVTRNGGFSPAWLGGGTAPPLPAAVFIPTPVIRQTPMVQPTHTQVVVTVESRPTIRPTLPLPPTPKPTVAPTPKTIPAAKVRPTPVLAPTPSRKKAAAAPTPAATAGKARDKKIPVQTATQISAGKQTVAAKGTAPATIVEDSYEDYEKFEEYADEDQVVLPPEALAEQESGNKIVYAPKIEFYFAKDLIKPDSLPVLKQLAAKLNENPDGTLVVKGYMRGPVLFKKMIPILKTLSRARANSVLRHLIVNEKIRQINVNALGEGDPFPELDADEDRILLLVEIR